MSQILGHKFKSDIILYKFSCDDDEIFSEEFLQQLSVDPYSWLCASECSPDCRNFSNERQDAHSDCSALDPSCRQIDSRTFIRRKRSSILPDLGSCQPLEDLYNKPVCIKSKRKSSLGIISSSLINESPTDNLFEPALMRRIQERNFLDSTDSEATVPRGLRQFESPRSTDLEYKANNRTFTRLESSKLDTSESVKDFFIRDIKEPSFINVSSMNNSLISAESLGSLEYSETEINNFNNLTNENLLENEAENIAPVVNMNSTMVLDKSVNSTNLLKTTLSRRQTVTPNRTRCSTPNISMSEIHQLSSQKIPLNTTFTRPDASNIFTKTLNNRFTKSIDGLNNGVEVEDDQVSTTSDSSYSSCSNLPRSVGDLHTIARLQEESLEEPKCHSTPEMVKSSNGLESATGVLDPQESTPIRERRRKIIEEVFCEDPVSPIKKSFNGDMPDHSDKLSELSSSAHLGPSLSDKCTLASVSQPTVHTRSATTVSAGSIPLPASRIRPPSVFRGSGIPQLASRLRPQSVPLPSSQIPSPRFRGRTIPRPKQ